MAGRHLNVRVRPTPQAMPTPARRRSARRERCTGCKPRPSNDAADEIGGAFGDHDRWCIGVAAHHARHHRGIGHAQSIDAMHAQLVIHHGSRSRRYWSDDKRIGRAAEHTPRHRLSEPDFGTRCGSLICARIAGRAAISRPMRMPSIMVCRSSGCSKIVVHDLRFGCRIGAAERNFAAALRLQHTGAEGDSVGGWRSSSLAA